MKVYTSNRIERLVDALAEAVSRPLGSPFVRECIAVQGPAMERYLSMELSSRLGVWANAEFPFPRSIVERALGAALGEPEGSARFFQRDLMLWTIAGLLPELIDKPQFGPMARYLEADRGARRRLQLAGEIADLFDDYLVYRPRLVLRWEQGQEDGWQSVLWRALTERYGTGHIAARAEKFLSAAAVGGAARELVSDFPRRISLFALGSLPPLYLRVLDALPDLIELHLFVLSPSPAYLESIRSQAPAIRKLLDDGADAARFEQSLRLTQDNPLLDSLGRVSRDLLLLVQPLSGDGSNEVDLHLDPGTDSALHLLQSDIFHLHRRHPAVPGCPPRLLAAGDDSISVHSCHGQMRQVEVLHDQLLALFDRDRSLQPEQVVVMMPDVELFAPAIETVFGAGVGGRPRIPFCMADRGAREANEPFKAFRELLRVLGERMSFSEVMDLLDLEPVRARFEIEADQMEGIYRKAAEAGVRWGVDAEHRRAVGQPDFDEYSWRFGLERLLLGYALPGDGQRLFAGRLACDDVEGGEAEAVGRLADFCETLFEARESFTHARSMAQWCEQLLSLLQRTIHRQGRAERHYQQIVEALATLGERAREAGFDEPVQLRTVRAQLERLMDAEFPAFRFLSGGVNFCRFAPMRSVPFRVVCMLGMDNDALTSSPRAPGFDLIALGPAIGDRSPRDETRHFFLEALLNARERVIICFQGQDIQNNSKLPPSVLVDELLDTLVESTAEPAAADGEPARSDTRDRWLLLHPLQPFSPRYFTPSSRGRLFSYASGYLQGARSAASAREQQQPFLPRPLPLEPGVLPERELEELELEELLRFFRHPARSFLQRRLGLYLEEEAGPAADREPHELRDHLERWRMGNELLDRARQGLDPESLLETMRAGGRLPPGTPGRCDYDDLAAAVRRVAVRAAPYWAAEKLPPLGFERDLGPIRLRGSLRNLFACGQLQVGYSKVTGDNELEIWIRHLILGWLAPKTVPPTSLLVGRPEKGEGAEVVRFNPVTDPESRLQELVQLYLAGQPWPLPFLPRSSRAYFTALSPGSTGGGNRERALGQAREALPGEGFLAATERDRYLVQLYGEPGPLPDEPAPGQPAWDRERFEQVASTVYAPLFEHREKP